MKTLLGFFFAGLLASTAALAYLSGRASDLPSERELCAALMSSPAIVAGRVAEVSRAKFEETDVAQDILKVQVDHIVKGNTPPRIRVVLSDEWLHEVNGEKSAYRYQSVIGDRFMFFLESSDGQTDVFYFRRVHPLNVGAALLPAGSLPKDIQKGDDWRMRFEREALSAIKSEDERVVTHGILMLFMLEDRSERATAAVNQLLGSESAAIRASAERFFARIAADSQDGDH